MGQASSASSSSSRCGSLPPSAPLVSKTSTPTKAKEHDRDLDRVFRRFDADGDGRISATEIQELQGCTAVEAEEMVAAVDSDGDGFINIEEFRALLEGGKSDAVRMAFAVYDENGDGMITAEELYRVLCRLGEKDLAVEKCSEMIAAVDKDGDGLVSFDEFKAMMATTSS